MHDSFGIHSFHTIPLQLLPRHLPLLWGLFHPFIQGIQPARVIHIHRLRRIRRILLLLLSPPRAFHEQERSGKDHFARRRLDERRISVLVNRELLPPIDPHLRFCGGLGSGSMWMPTSYVVFDSFNKASVKRVTGFVSAGTAIGLLFFTPLENYLIMAWSIQTAFLIVGLIVFVFTILAYQTSRNSRVASGFAFGEAFRRLRTKRFGFLYLYYSAGNAFSRTLVTIFLVPLLESRGLGTLAGTLALVLIGVGSLTGRLTVGVQRFNEETMAAFGFILQGVCAAALFLASDTVTIGVLSVLFGIGYGTYIPEFALLVRKYYGLDHY